VFMLHLFI